ncbi:hypothetical protein EUTSA_v10005321mg [Eutrema salsugineum]|uniref:Uncharacterized protein n=1 Tax=Eutrema salsugineum TaxID=72664 RepID=V4L035_EUTSA|nr:gibberellin-regulated protein 12 isoform X1 [Eutrema salsugineum]XP_024007522.1 gibberellin-regulated protein 12 isoform X2 [Eutrema salsugineum]ESQ33063.1 hypothetical protein EUTSA_v10005321mg [Eutrema salsugineum]
MAKFIAVFLVVNFLFATQCFHAEELESPSQAPGLQGGEGSLHIEDCPKACNYRCSATSHKSACLMYCNLCCEKCLCVPSGTYGHKEECPCYNNWKTHEGGPKCP